MSKLMALLGLCMVAGAPAARAKPTLVATLPDLGAVARAVAGDDWEVVVLAEATEDPHYVDPRPSFLVTLAKADALLFNGLDLEIGWLPPLIQNARNPKVQLGSPGHIDASRFVRALLQVTTGKVDRAMGDIHPGGNPHFNLGPDAVIELARGLAGHLTLLDGKNAAAYSRRAEALATAIGAVKTRERARFDALSPEQKRVVVYHDSLPYLVEWLGLEQVATVENKPGIRPSPAHVAEVLATMKARGARVILQEIWQPEAASKNLAALAGGKVVALQGGAGAREDYAARLEALAEAVYRALAE